MRISLDHFIHANPDHSTQPLAIIVHNAPTPAMAKIYLKRHPSHSSAATSDCYLDDPAVQDLVKSRRLQIVPLEKSRTQWNLEYNVTDRDQGMWVVALVNCRPDSSLGFHFHSENLNPDGNHLTAGDIPLPRIYGLMSVLYSLVVLLWLYYQPPCSSQSKPATRNDAFGVPFRTKPLFLRHYYLILTFLVLVTFHKALQGYKMARMARGLAVDIWVVGFYISTFLKGLLGIVVIAMIASGWLFMRSFLTLRDKRILGCVIPLQTFTTIANFLKDEMAIGSTERLVWLRIIPIMDLGAFLVILWTIWQTQKYLRQASEIDGKAARNLRRHKLWGSFYVLTLMYLYGTRVVARYLNVSLPYQYVRWVSELLVELISLAFYLTVGYKIRPMDALGDDDTEEASTSYPLGRTSIRGRRTDDQDANSPWRPSEDGIYEPLQLQPQGDAAPHEVRHEVHW
ncbi:hypothetical protein IWQ61_001093 [Dispira simplex]|nr:hypothetical protein IWQ61_001093 [Dispira simplex]